LFLFSIGDEVFGSDSHRSSRSIRPLCALNFVNREDLNMKDVDVFAVTLDQGAIIVEFNDFASKLTGYSPDEVIGKNWFEIFIKPKNLIEIL